MPVSLSTPTCLALDSDRSHVFDFATGHSCDLDEAGIERTRIERLTARRVAVCVGGSVRCAAGAGPRRIVNVEIIISEHHVPIENIDLEVTSSCSTLVCTSAKLVDANVMAKNEILDIVDTTLFLSLTLDTKWRWNSHVTRLAKGLVL
ncbi:hypothetical protein EVAR_40483_1 [Eumeta japonica]|uniref:Uncharacterized protein n=1 Tax=Eumeta variegata TaxID=151549 RepID=A0A4C1XYT8_EUMVA|nr:hypothetical protein EVAR_40483_1 [Eumeta japonica]